MLKHTGGQKATKGTYWNLSSGQRINITGEEILPGDKKTVYFKIPSTGLLLLAPFIGLAYAVFLPFIGIAMMLKLIGQKIFGGALKTTARSASFGWRPKEAYLAGKQNENKEEKKDEPEPPEKDK